MNDLIDDATLQKKEGMRENDVCVFLQPKRLFLQVQASRFCCKTQTKSTLKTLSQVVRFRRTLTAASISVASCLLLAFPFSFTRAPLPDSLLSLLNSGLSQTKLPNASFPDTLSTKKKKEKRKRDTNFLYLDQSLVENSSFDQNEITPGPFF